MTVLLLVASSLTSAAEALGDDGTTVQATPASDFQLERIDPSELDDPSILYAGMLWSVTGVRTIDADGLLQRSAIEIDVTLTNTLTNAQLRVPESMVMLVVDNDSATSDEIGDPRFVDAGRRLAIDPGESLSVTIDFEVGFTQTPDLDDFTLRIAEQNRVPATIALSGDGSGSGEAVFAAVDTNARSTADPDAGSRQIVIAPIAASVDINAGPYRAAIGERLAVIKVAVQRVEASPDNGFLHTSYWALEADGVAVPAILVAPAGAVASNADELTLLFAYPEDGEELRLIAGANAADGGIDFAVVLPG